MEVINVKQGTPEWHKLRLAKITGTRLKSVMGGEQARATLIYELIAEELTEEAEKLFVNEAMKWGVEHEDIAIWVYEQTHGVKTEEVGFCLSEEFDFIGLSPDRLIKKGKKYVKGVEVKAPTSKTVVKYMVDKRIPPEYKWQVVHYFLVCDDLKFLDFLVFDPRIKENDLKLTTISVTRKDMQDDIDGAKERLKEFRKEWLNIKSKIKA